MRKSCVQGLPAPVAVQQRTVPGFYRLERIVLIDAGAGSLFPTGGRLLQSLVASGYAAQDITDVMITHIHGDHSAGLSPGGKPVFPNATVHVDGRDAKPVNAPSGSAIRAALLNTGNRYRFMRFGRTVGCGKPVRHRLADLKAELQPKKLVPWTAPCPTKMAEFASPSQ